MLTLREGMRSRGASGPKPGKSNYCPRPPGHLGFQAATAGGYLACPWEKSQGGAISEIKWAVDLCSYPLLGHRHVARPAERRHDCHHVHSGLPALLSARGFRWSHHPQLCVSSSGKGGARRLPRKGSASGFSGTGPGGKARGNLPWY